MSIRKRYWPDPKTGPKMAWALTYKDKDGVKRQKTFPTRGAAKAWESETLVALKAGTHVADKATITVDVAAANWIAKCTADKLERSTIEGYKQHVRLHIVPFVGSALLSKVTVPFIRQFEDDLRSAGRSEAMVKRAISSLGAIIADAMESGLAAHNAVRSMRGSRKGRQRRQEERHKTDLIVGRDIPSPAEMKAFLAVLEGRWKPLLMTAAFCGLRSSELRGLPWSDVDLAKRELRVQQRADRFGEIGSPKSKGSRRTVPIPAMTAQALREWRLICPKAPTGQVDASGKPIMALNLVFANGAGGDEMHGNIVRRGLQPAMIKAGLVVPSGKLDADGKPIMKAKYGGLHALRHWFASWCINPVSAGGMGLTLKEVQTRMGHASIELTSDRYGHLFPKGDTTSEVDAAERALLG